MFDKITCDREPGLEGSYSGQAHDPSHICMIRIPSLTVNIIDSCFLSPFVFFPPNMSSTFSSFVSQASRGKRTAESRTVQYMLYGMKNLEFEIRNLNKKRRFETHFCGSRGFSSYNKCRSVLRYYILYLPRPTTFAKRPQFSVSEGRERRASIQIDTRSMNEKDKSFVQLSWSRFFFSGKSSLRY